MAVFLSESFTGANGTLIPTHNAAFEELGWDLLGSATTSQHTISSNHAIATTTTSPGSRVLRCTTDPGADEYNATATLRFRDPAQANRFHAILVRMDPTATDYASCDHYRLFVATNDAPNWKLSKVVGGTVTELDTFDAATANTTASVRIEVRSTGLQVFLDEALILETTDTAITQRGRVGFGSRRGDGTVHWIDDLIGDSVTGTAPNEVTTTIPLALALSADSATDHDVIATIPLDLDLTSTTAATHEVTAALPLSVLLDADTETQHDVTASFALALGVGPVADAPAVGATVTAEIPLALALSGSVATDHAVTATLPLVLALAGSTETVHDVTAAFPLGLLLAGSTAVDHEVTASVLLAVALAGEVHSPIAAPPDVLTLTLVDPPATLTNLTPVLSLRILEDE